MEFHEQAFGRSRRTSSSSSFVSRITAILCVFVFVLAVTAGQAWSFESEYLNLPNASQVSGGVSITSSGQHLSSSMGDSCLLLLKSVHSSPTTSSMDRNQRAAGQAAALGLVLGVRFALTPPKQPGRSAGDIARFDGVQIGLPKSRNALAIAEYRSCQKHKALKALSTFRWQR